MKRLIVTIIAVLIVSRPSLGQDDSSTYTKPYQKKALEIFRDSIGYRTARTHDQVPEYAKYLADEFPNAGFPGEDIHILPATTVEGEEIASLVVTYRGDGSSGRKPILLLAHMDVVDALAEDWEQDPFVLIEEDGFFFGRGTLDDKFGITTLTSNFLRLKAEGFTPHRDLVIGSAGDEETAMTTIRSLVNDHRELTDAEFALNADSGLGLLDHDGEPVAYLLESAEKTFATFEVTVRNPGGHSSMPRTDNAIYDLARILEKIRDYRFPVRSNEIMRKYFKMMADASGGKIADAMRRFARYPLDEEASEILYRHPAQVGLTRTTGVATMLQLGHAANALPQSASATVNCRIFPGVPITNVENTLRRLTPIA